MADLGDLIGSLMVGLIRARRMADEQTAVLAEYYKTNPLLESLSVPRVRIPELTIDLPFVVEDHVEGQGAKMQDPARIATEVHEHLVSTLSKNNITLSPTFLKKFSVEMKKQLATVKSSGLPVVKEAVVRGVQTAFTESLSKTKTDLTLSDQAVISKALRTKTAAIGIAKAPIASSIVANIRTEDVKEKASNANVVRLKITLKEEGLEWAVQSNESGGETRTLQPE